MYLLCFKAQHNETNSLSLSPSFRPVANCPVRQQQQQQPFLRLSTSIFSFFLLFLPSFFFVCRRCLALKFIIIIFLFRCLPSYTQSRRCHFMGSPLLFFEVRCLSLTNDISLDFINPVNISGLRFSYLSVPYATWHAVSHLVNCMYTSR